MTCLCSLAGCPVWGVWAANDLHSLSIRLSTTDPPSDCTCPEMNWTGGQLRRHSARPGVLSKNQRQNFAKSRQLTSSRASAQPTPFRRFPDGFSKDGTGELAEANQSVQKLDLYIALSLCLVVDQSARY